MDTTALPRKDRRLLRRLRRSFQRVAGPEGYIDAATLNQALGIRNKDLGARFFAVFDTNRNGRIEEEEFLAGLGALMGSSETERLRFLFRMYDEGGKGYITRPRFTRLLELTLQEHNLALGRRAVNDLAWALFRKADADQNGSISFDEFHSVLADHPEASHLNLDVADWIGPSVRSREDRRRNRRPRIRRPPLWRRFGRSMQNEGLSHFWLLAYLSANALLFLDAVQRYEALGANIWVQIARGCGACLNFNGAMILVPVMRNLLTWIRRGRLGRVVPVDAAIDFHKLAGQLMFAFGLVHTGAHFTNYWIMSQSAGRPGEWYLQIAWYLQNTQAGLSGAILLGVFALMWLTAQNFVRRGGHFEVFAVTHGLYLAWFGLMLWHGPVFWKWFLIPGVIYLVERWFRARRSKARSMIRATETYDSGVTHLRIDRPKNWDYRPADYMFIRIPSISRSEWHPFTISSSPEQPDELGVHIRTLGNWTRAVFRRFKGREAGRGYRPVPIVLDGPYGTPSMHIFDCTHAVLIGAGIGATPFASVLRTIQLKNHKREPMPLERVHFYWLNRGQYAFEWFTEMLADIEKRRINDLIDINIYMTDVKPDLKTGALDLAMDALYAQNRADPVTGLRSRTNFGHPDWTAIIADLSERYRGQKVNVFFCGPAGLAAKIRPLCKRAGFGFRKENF